jgi:Na+/H+-translocating membrane pyrophosphatase
MDDAIGLLSITRAWSVEDGQQVWRITWTTEQLQRIAQAIEEGDQAFLATVEEAMRRALGMTLTPPKG